MTLPKPERSKEIWFTLQYRKTPPTLAGSSSGEPQ